MTNIETNNLDEALASVLSLYRRSLNLQAWKLLNESVDLKTTRYVPAVILAGRILGHLAVNTESARYFYRAARLDRKSFTARCYAISTVLSRLGPLRAQRMMRATPEVMIPSGNMTEEQASDLAFWYSLQSGIASSFRDFSAAEKLHLKADTIDQNSSWLTADRISLLMEQDRYTEALELSTESIKTFPDSSTHYQLYASLLELQGRRLEAVQVLADCAERFESPYVYFQIMHLQRSMADYASAELSLTAAIALMPFIEAEAKPALIGYGADLSYRLGRMDEFLKGAEDSRHPYYLTAAANLKANGSDAPLVLLDVPFVRQHHLTCAPATLTAISKYFGQPADHLEIADAICYAGTPYYSQRKWAIDSGWYVREFTVTWESCIELIDRGVPFTLSTTGAGYAHLQAVAGYDARLGTLCIRDPYRPDIEEPFGNGLLARLTPYGPRGMALVPMEKRALIEDLNLADTALYDLLYDVEAALAEHNREEAIRKYDAIAEQAPEHVAAYYAGSALASYDSDRMRSFELVEARSKQWPEEPNMLMSRISWLRILGRREERLQLLEQVCRTRRGKTSRQRIGTVDTDTSEADVERVAQFSPLFLHLLASELMEDARDENRAEAILLRAIRMSPTRDESLWTLASLYWQEGRQQEATELYRFAACLDPYDEGNARSYFIAERWFNKEEEALAFLRDRAARYASRSHLPVCTLFDSLEQTDRMEEAFKTISSAVDSDPSNGELRLFAARAYARYGQLATAERLIAQAEGHAAQTSLLRARARLFSQQNKLSEALECWQKLLEQDPLSMELHQECAYLLGQMNGPAAAAKHYQDAVDAFPNHFELYRHWCRWLRELTEKAKHEAALRRMLDINPAEAWTYRELALLLNDQRRREEALQYAQMSVQLEPRSPGSHGILGDVYLDMGNLAAAKAAYTTAIQLDIDYDYGQRRLLETCTTPQERRDAIHLVAAELGKQVQISTGVEAFLHFAESVLDAGAIEQTLINLVQRLPHLAEARLALVDHYLERDKPNKALNVAEDAASRFPLNSSAWQKLADVRAALQNRPGEREALGYAMKISPRNLDAARQLARSYASTGETDRAVEIMQQAITWDRLDRLTHEYYAYMLEKSGKRAEAVEAVRIALDLDPGSQWAWGAYSEWSAKLGHPEEAPGLVRQMVAERPNEYRVWLALAEILDFPADTPERLAAIDKVLELNPRCDDAYGLRAEILCGERRFKEALDSLRVPPELMTPAIGLYRAQTYDASGDRQMGIDTLKKLVQEDPNDPGAWHYLIQKLAEGDDKATYLETARKYVVQEPTNSRAWAHLGEASRRSELKVEAIRAHKRAVELRPDYEYSAVELVKLQIDVADLTGAGATVDALKSFDRQGWVIACEVRLALARKNASAIAQGIRRLCAANSDYSAHLIQAVKLVCDSGSASAARHGLDTALMDPNAMPEAGNAWVTAALSAGENNLDAQITKALAVGEAGAHAAAAWINYQMDQKHFKEVQKFISSCKLTLSRQTISWAVTAHAYTRLEKHKLCDEWTADWKSRPNLEAWMLLNRVASLRCLQKDAESAQVSRAALGMERDHSTVLHALWLLWDSRLAGTADDPVAARVVEHTEPTKLPEYYQFIFWLCEAIRRGNGAEIGTEEKPEDRFRDVRNNLATALKTNRAYRSRLDTLRLYRKARFCCVKRLGGFGPIAWAALNVIVVDATRGMS